MDAIQISWFLQVRHESARRRFFSIYFRCCLFLIRQIKTIHREAFKIISSVITGQHIKYEKLQFSNFKCNVEYDPWDGSTQRSGGRLQETFQLDISTSIFPISLAGSRLILPLWVPLPYRDRFSSKSIIAAGDIPAIFCTLRRDDYEKISIPTLRLTFNNSNLLAESVGEQQQLYAGFCSDHKEECFMTFTSRNFFPLTKTKCISYLAFRKRDCTSYAMMVCRDASDVAMLDRWWKYDWIYGRKSGSNVLFPIKMTQSATDNWKQ